MACVAYSMAEVAPLVRRPVQVEPDQIYQEIGVRSFGKGIFHKPPSTSLVIGDKKVFAIEPGDLLFNIVFAWEGAVAVAGEEERGTIGSHRFLTCVTNPQIALARYLYWYFIQERGLKQLQLASPGGAGRNRTLGTDKLAAIVVELPSIEEQQQVVDRLDGAARQIAGLRQVARAMQAELRATLNSAFRKAIVRAVGREFDFEILSMLPWVRRQLVADQYGRGRAFIAGDAAHLTSPTGGFGMNTGILDVVNLSWKLAGRIQGWGGEHLLDTYDSEQRPVAVRNVTEAGENLKRMLSPRILQPDPAVFDQNSPEAEAARKEYGARYTEMMRREWFSIGIHLGYVYEGSPIVVPDGTPAPADEVSSYTPTARPGSRAPHVWLPDGRSILDLFGRSFVLLRFQQDSSNMSQLATAAQRVGLPLEIIDIDNDEAGALYKNKLVLVRPDGQVAWRADSLPADARELIDIVRGAVSPQAGVQSAHAVLTTQEA